MSIQTLPAQFEHHNLDIVIIGNEKWVMSSHIGYSLGFAFVAQAMGKLYKRNQKEFGTDDTMVVELPDRLGRMQLTRLFSAKGIAKVAMFANTDKAAAFRDWAATALTSPRPPEPEPELLLANPFSKSVNTELKKLWLHSAPNRKFLRYAKLGLTNVDIGKLCDWRAPSTANIKRRTAEALGLLPVDPRLAHFQARGANLGIKPKAITS